MTDEVARRLNPQAFQDSIDAAIREEQQRLNAHAIARRDRFRLEQAAAKEIEAEATRLAAEYREKAWAKWIEANKETA